jgi:hypothetical protein
LVDDANRHDLWIYHLDTDELVAAKVWVEGGDELSAESPVGWR